jgi:hypothetical protein
VTGPTGASGTSGTAGATGPTGPAGMSSAKRVVRDMAAIGTAPTTVSGTLVLDPGSYVVSAKLSATFTQDGPHPMTIELTCQLLQGGTMIDDVATTVAANQTEALALASTAVVSGSPSNLTVMCAADVDVAVTATSVQLIAVRVDDVVESVAP